MSTSDQHYQLLKTLKSQFLVFRAYLPLAIGINKQLSASLPEVDPKVLRRVIGMHTKSYRYLLEMNRTPVRFDLLGNPAGEVTETDRMYAHSVLKERNKKTNERKKAQQAEEQVRQQVLEKERQHIQKLIQLSEKFAPQY